MSAINPSYTIFPLGDTALTIDFGGKIDIAINQRVIQLFQQLSKAPIQGTTAIIPAYSSITIVYDVIFVKKKCIKSKTAFHHMAEELEERLTANIIPDEKLIKKWLIPVCYDASYGTDLITMAGELKILPEEIIKIHSSTIYKVFMLGFLPGFAYMGIVPDAIAIGRKNKPVQVAAGSVGIAGKQTGIYPFHSPGGWQIVGRTPLMLFNKSEDHPTLLQPGDDVQFISITKDEMEERLQKNELKQWA